MGVIMGVKSKSTATTVTVIQATNPAISMILGGDPPGTRTRNQWIKSLTPVSPGLSKQVQIIDISVIHGTSRPH